MRPRVPIIALAALIGFGLAQRRMLELAVDDSPAGLDPHIVTAFASVVVTGRLHDSLLEVNAALQLEPAPATGYTVSAYGLTYTFTLRQCVTFHNGRPVTAPGQGAA